MGKLRTLIDPYLLLLIGTVALAAVLPASGKATGIVDLAVNLAVALLFLLYGARLKPEAIWSGLSHWRLQSLIFASTYVLFPLIGVAMTALLRGHLPGDIVTGLMFLCLLPSTVQSSIAFTSIARGNIPAAICSAATSSLMGIFITPLLVLLMLGQSAHSLPFGDAVLKIMLQLLLPFVLGQLARRWIGAWVDRHKAVLKHVDQTSIYLVVYTAFSSAVVEGLWSQLPLQQILVLALACCVLLALVLGATWWLGRRLGFDLADRITILFCGSKKSLATGVPMAQVLFIGGSMGTLLLPLMLFHQIQLFVCAVLSKRLADRADEVHA